MNLLITDPATSPRTPLARLVFGAAYGAFVFVLYGWLQSIGQPAYFDKLIQVPVLNAMVPIFAVVGAWLARWAVLETMSRRRWLQVGGWCLAFALIRPGLVEHPGADPSYWQPRCEAGVPKACANQRHALAAGCGRGMGEMCFALYEIMGDEKSSWFNPIEASQFLGKACRLGHEPACAARRSSLQKTPKLKLDAQIEAAACDGGDGEACRRLGTALLRPDANGQKAVAAAAYRLGQGCELDRAEACLNLGLMTLRGDGVLMDKGRALELHERACQLGSALGCARTAALYQQGVGAQAEPEKAKRFLQKACQLGDFGACVNLRGAELRGP